MARYLLRGVVQENINTHDGGKSILSQKLEELGFEAANDEEAKKITSQHNAIELKQLFRCVE